MTCFACENEPAQQCPRCGRPYCDDHGEDLCDACLHPTSGVPSFSLFRGSMLALLIASALAVWLLVQPPGSEGEALRPLVVTPTAVVARGLTTPGANATQQAPAVAATSGAGPVATQPAAGAGSPIATRPAGTVTAGTPTTGATPAAAGVGEYTVASGDTISTICERRKPAAMTVADCVERVIALNSLTSAGNISIGDKLRIPQ